MITIPFFQDDKDHECDACGKKTRLLAAPSMLPICKECAEELMQIIVLTMQEVTEEELLRIEEMKHKLYMRHFNG